jgi:hypothetical protein
MTIFPEFEDELRGLARRSSAAGPASRAGRGPRWARLTRGLRAFPILASVAVTVAVVATVLAVTGRNRPSAPSQAATVPAVNQNTSGLAVLRRAQTEKDRTFPALVRRAARLGGLNIRTVESFLRGATPTSMRYAQTLPDGREVFLVQVHEPHVDQLSLGLWIIAPDGSRRDGQPIVHATFGLPDNRIARIQARFGPSCSVNMNRTGVPNGLTVWGIVPDGVARVRWQLPREDSQGHPLSVVTLDVAVHGNTAVATIPGPAFCEQASAVTLYAADGRIIAR